MESPSCHTTSLPALACSSSPIAAANYSSNAVVLSKYGLFGLCSYHLSLPSKLDSARSFWKIKVLIDSETYFWMEQWLTSGVWPANITCRKTTFFADFRFSFIKDYGITVLHLPAEDLSSILEKPEKSKGLTSKLYTNILRFDPSPLPKIKQEWENELGVQFQDHWWEKAKLQVNDSFSCNSSFSS